MVARLPGGRGNATLYSSYRAAWAGAMAWVAGCQTMELALGRTYYRWMSIGAITLDGNCTI